MKINSQTAITVFGDSIGKGIFSDGGQYSVMQDSAVSLFEREYGIKTDNRSAFGQSMKRLYTRGVFDRFLSCIDEGKENVVVIELGGNDSDFNWKEVAENPEKEHSSLTGVKEFSQIYGEVIKKMKARGVKIVTCTIVPISSERFFDNVIGKIADKSKVLEFFKGDMGTIHRHQEMFNNEILKNSYIFGSEVIDLRRRFLDTNEFENIMCLDGIHPNFMGQKEIFRAVREFISA